MGAICNEERSTNNTIIKEKHIDGRPHSMSLKQMKFLTNQMENIICKIQKSNNVTGTGFLCKIPNNGKSDKIPALITCNHVLEKNDLSLGKEIKLIFRNEIVKTLKINKTRKIYTNKVYDISIIEIKKNDNFNEKDMLEIDKNIYKDELGIYYKNRQVYIIHYPNGNEVRYSTDLIKNIDASNTIIEHLCSTETGSSGGPLINFETGDVMGIHIGCKSNKINLGTVLKKPIDEFNKIKHIIKNEIILTLEIKKDDVNKDIYFLDNADYTDDLVDKKNPEDDCLSELNESNVKLYINNKIYKYSKSFRPEKEGIFTIKLELGIKMKNCERMFHGCYNIINMDLSNFDTKNVTNMKYMFSGCNNLKNIDLSNFITDNVTNMSYMLYNCGKLENIDLSAFNTENVIDMGGLFCGCKVKSLDLNYLNTKKVTNITHMFYRCEEITNLDLSSFNTENVQNMSGLFAGCKKLNNLDLSSFDTKNVFYMSHLFYDCQNLTNLVLNNFDTKNVDNMNSMFSNCFNLRTLDLSSFDTKNVINMGSMFFRCKHLVNLDLRHFDTSNVIYLYDMFNGCENLYNLDISSFNCCNINQFYSRGMFQNCKSLTNITISFIDYNNISFLHDLNQCGSKSLYIKYK